MANSVSDKERQTIIDLLNEHGGNRNKVAKICGRGHSTVQRIAEQAGIVSGYTAPKKANEARSEFAEAERKQIVVDGFRKAQELLKNITDSADFQKWTVGVGTLIDKDLLLSGKPTNINENRKGETLKDFFGDAEERAMRQWANGDDT